MTQEINLLISLAAGLLSFLSPCVLPLVPTYLSVIGGTTFQDLQDGRYKKGSLLIRALLFISGFTAVFVALGLFLWGSFRLAGDVSPVLNVAAGSIVILLGLDMLFDFFSFLKREKRWHPARRPVTYIGVFAAGMALGAGWSPCIGPLLGSILALAASGESVWGVANLIAYSLGLGLPFIVLALAFVPVSARLEKIKKHYALLRIASGVLLIGVGILILLGQFFQMSAVLFPAGLWLENAYRSQPWAMRIAFAAFYLGIGGAPLLILLCKKKPPETAERLRPPIVRLVWACIFTGLAALELAGLLQSALLLSRWFLAGELSPL